MKLILLKVENIKFEKVLRKKKTKKKKKRKNKILTNIKKETKKINSFLQMRS